MGARRALFAVTSLVALGLAIVVVGFVSGPGATRGRPAPRVYLTREGHLLWNLEALLRVSRGASEPLEPCVAINDPRTTANFDGASVEGVCTPLAGFVLHRYDFAGGGSSAFRLLATYHPGEELTASTQGAPVLVGGRPVQCGSRPTRLLVNPQGGFYGNLDLSCISVAVAHRPWLGVYVSAGGRGDADKLTKAFSSRGWILDWSLACAGAARGPTPRLSIRVSTPTGGHWEEGSGGRNTAGEEIFPVVDHFRLQIRAANASRARCEWHVWAFAQAAPYL